MKLSVEQKTACLAEVADTLYTLGGTCLHQDSHRKTMIAEMAKGLVYHCFRNGPIEDIHADGRISNDEMKEIMQTAVTEVAKKLEEYFVLPTILVAQLTQPSLMVDAKWSEPDWDHIMAAREAMATSDTLDFSTFVQRKMLKMMLLCDPGTHISEGTKRALQKPASAPWDFD